MSKLEEAKAEYEQRTRSYLTKDQRGLAVAAFQDGLEAAIKAAAEVCRNYSRQTKDALEVGDEAKFQRGVGAADCYSEVLALLDTEGGGDDR